MEERRPDAVVADTPPDRERPPPAWPPLDTRSDEAHRLVEDAGRETGEGPAGVRPPEPVTVETPDEAAPTPTEEATLARFFTRLVPAFRAFRYRHYRLLWGSNVLSSTGSWMQNAAYGVIILRITGSPFMTAFIPASMQLLMGPLGPVGGMLADRYNRRNLLIATQVGFALTTVTIGLLVLTGHGSAYAFLATSLVYGIFIAFNFPAYQGLFPRLVPAEELTNAVAMNSVTFNLARTIGPALGALVMRVWGEAEVFLVNAATFLLFAAALTRIPSAMGRISAADRDHLGSIGDGFRFTRRNATVRTMVLGIATISLFALPLVWLGPLMARRVFGDASAHGFILSAMGAGAVIGALASGSTSSDRRPNVAVAAFFVLAASLGGFAVTTTPALSLVFVGIFGAAYMGASVVTNSLVQLATPDRLRGRVMSVYMIAWMGLLPIGAVVSGGLAEAAGGGIGAPVALGAGAFFCLLFSIRLALKRDWVPVRFASGPEAAPVAE